MSRRSSFGIAVAAAVLMAGLAASAVAAAQQPAAPAAPAAAAERRIRDEVLARYRVLPVQNGIILVPLARIEGVDNIELREGTIAINGRAVTGGEVRERLGRGADIVLELSYLPLNVQKRALLGSEAEARPTSPEAPRPPAAPGVEVPPVPAVPDVAERLGEPFRDRTFARRTDARVRVGGSISVPEDERVSGAVVAVAGSITIDGRVDEDVVAVGGGVHLGRKAEVGGDIVVVGGAITRDAGAVVHGRVSEIGIAIPGIRIRPVWRDLSFPWFGSGPWRAFMLFASVVRMVLFALLAILILLIAPKAADRVQTAVTTQFWQSALAGLLAQLFFVPVLVLTVVVLAVSIIGIPLLVLVPFGVLAFFVALLLGFAGAASGLGRLIQVRASGSGLSKVGTFAVGAALIWGITLLGRLVGLGGGPLAAVGAIVVTIGFVAEYAAWTVGLGAALLTRLGRRGPLQPVVPSVPGPSPEGLGGDLGTV